MKRLATEVAWAAGVFEGEGCFTRSKGRWALAAVSMSDGDVVRRFGQAIGFGRVRGPYHYKNRKPMWTWAVGNFQYVQALAAMFWPWLGARRRARVKAILLDAREQRGHRMDHPSCKQGHEMSVGNRYEYPDGRVACRICRRQWDDGREPRRERSDKCA